MTTTDRPVDSAYRMWLRVALLAVGVALVASAVAFGARTASLSQLQGQLALGNVDTVTVSGGMPPGATGFATQQVRWRQGWLHYEAEVVQVSRGRHPSGDLETRTVVHQDVGAVLRRDDPDLTLVRHAEPDYLSGRLWGWQTPQWIGLAALTWYLLALGQLIFGPQPWRATRWAWFWLFSTPVGALAFLALSGPTPGLRAPRDPARRLTGGWAFLLSLLLTGAVRSG